MRDWFAHFVEASLGDMESSIKQTILDDHIVESWLANLTAEKVAGPAS